MTMDFEIGNCSLELSTDKQHTNVDNGDGQMVDALSTTKQHTNVNNGHTLSAISLNDEDITYNTYQPNNDHSVVVYSKYGNECSTLHEVELPVMQIEGLEQTIIGYKDIQFGEQNEVIDCINLDLNDLTTYSMQSNRQQTEVADVAVNLSELSSRDKIFCSNVETAFGMSDFGISDHLLSQSSQSKLSKLTQKVRRDVKELAIMCAAADKTKLVNILVINQQLNIIDPPDVPLDEPAEISNQTRTIQSILVPPTMPQRIKAKTRRNIKVGYGVATAAEVLEHLEEREILDGQLEIEQEENEIEKKTREKN